MKIQKQVYPDEYTLIAISLKEGEILEPSILDGLHLPEVDARLGVVLSGRAPIWLYNAINHHYHPVAWIATHDPRIGYVVTATHSKLRKIGEVINPDSPTIV